MTVGNGARPSRRRLRVYTLDPMVREALPTTAELSVPWEPLLPGPVGRRLEVVDFDGVNRCYYQPVNLDDPLLAVQDGLIPDERDPQLHQQMVYAVASSVLEAFDRALGRRVQFRQRRLRLFPHAFYGVNALYVHDLDAILFGFYHATGRSDGIIDGQPIFACLSHDVIAHEVTHALTYRLRPKFKIRTNPDVQAFCEAIADLVALLLHFRLEGVLERIIAATSGEISNPSPLVQLAGQLGRSSGQQEALRSALRTPDPDSLQTELGPYQRASALVAAVFHGLFRAYEEEAQQLISLVTNGAGLPTGGPIPSALVEAVCRETRRISDRILAICIRAFDYLPPVDVTFGDFARAVITADLDFFPQDHSSLRRHLIAGFHRYGIQPEGVWSLSEAALRLDPAPPMPRLPVDPERITLDAAELYPLKLERSVNAGVDPDWSRWRNAGPPYARKLTAWGRENAQRIGLVPGKQLAAQHFHTSFRFDEDGQPRIDVIAQFLQRTHVEQRPGSRTPVDLWGGATVVSDVRGEVRYIISKQTPHFGPRGASRLNTILAFLQESEERSSASAGFLPTIDAYAVNEALHHGF